MPNDGSTGAISEGEEEHGNIGHLLSTIRNDVSLMVKQAYYDVNTGKVTIYE